MVICHTQTPSVPCIPRYVTVYVNKPSPYPLGPACPPVTVPAAPTPVASRCEPNGVPQGQLTTISALYCCPDSITEFYPTPAFSS